MDEATAEPVAVTRLNESPRPKAGKCAVQRRKGTKFTMPQ